MDIIEKNVWKQNQNFSLLHLYKEQHINDIAKSSLFYGTIVEENYWENVSIDNSDLEALKLLKTTIKKSSFANADIHSLLATNTDFYNVTFEDADITDCTFINCKFINCNFKGVALKECEFKNCILNKPIFSDGSYTLNSFFNCNLKDTFLKNVFYYTYFSNCSFEKVTMEAYLLGYTHGLTIDNLETLTYLFMGESCNCSYQKICRDILAIYKNRQMIINQGILYLSDPQIPVERAIIMCFECVYKYIQSDCLVQKEQMVFLEKIVTIMYNQKKISPLTLIYLADTINVILSIEKNVALEKAMQGLLNIKNNILSQYYFFMDELSKYISHLPQNGQVTIKITYETKPSYLLTNIINDIDNSKHALVIKTESGSYIEWIECATDVLPYINTFLAFLGVAVPLVTAIIGAKKNNIKKKEDQKQNIDYVVEINNNINITNLTKKELNLL